MRNRWGVAVLLIGLPALHSGRMGPACPVAGRAPGQHRPGSGPRKSRWRPQAECQPGGCLLHRQGQGRQPGSSPHQGRLHGLGRQGAADAQELCGRDASAADAGDSAGHLGQPAARALPGAGCGQPVPGARAQKKDEAFLLSFDVDVDLLQDYTNNARQLSRTR
jgi:hypothetical protein